MKLKIGRFLAVKAKLESTKYSKDTRTIKPGEYYVAIRGERYNGHDFILDAILKGAIGIIIEEDIADVQIPNHIKIIRVDNSIEFLANEANKRIQTLKTEIVAITGSVGKTTTKKAIASVLSQVFPIVESQDNLNTLLGLSLTVLNSLVSKDEILIIEMGTNRLGDLARMCNTFPPSVSVVLNVKPVHIATMGSIETIARAKKEIVDALDEKGTACLNFDDPIVRKMGHSCKGNVVFFGRNPDANITFDNIKVDIPLLGPYRIDTALAAYCVGKCFGLSEDVINRGLENIEPEKGRLVQLPGIYGINIIDDTYNASPVSMIAALEVLQNCPAKRRIALLADMLELGDLEVSGHHQVLEAALQVADIVLLIGPRFSKTTRIAEKTNTKIIQCYETQDEAIRSLQNGIIYQPREGDYLLCKGSASMRMERLVKLFLDPNVDASKVLVRQSESWKNL